MPRPGTGNRDMYARFTESELEVLQREKARRKLRSLSLVVEHAVLELLEGTDIVRDGMTVPVALDRLIQRNYRCAPETLRLVEDAVTRYGFRQQDILRAAVFRLAREAAAPRASAELPIDHQDPVHSDR